MKRQKISQRDIKDDDIDRLSDLPDHVLLHIMEFMNIKHAVQTCVLSKRWKDIWKRLTNLILHHSYPDRSDIFCKFVSQILSCRDGSIPLHSLVFEHLDLIDPPKTTLMKVMKYVASHNLHKLAINVKLRHMCDLELPPSIFYSRSLTFLWLGFRNPYCTNCTNWIKIPKSLNLPALKSLHLLHVTFTTSDNGCAEPFSTFNMLNTLVIRGCYLQDDAQALCISNSNVSSLDISGTYLHEETYNYKVVLCTPNLSFFTTNGRPTFEGCAACNLPFLEEVNIDYFFLNKPSEGLVLNSWFLVLANVKMMTLSLSTLFDMLPVLSNIGSLRTQPPCFVRLKSLKVVLRSNSKISDEKVSRMVKNLLQNSPPVRVDIIRQLWL